MAESLKDAKQTPPLLMTPHYDPVFVILSVIVAMLASFAALDLAGRVRSESGATRFGWLAGGATVMGLGIWSMHFVGMLAFHLPIPIKYDVPRMIGSMLVAVGASLFALMVISRPKLRVTTLMLSGLLMGVAIAGMHYLGMTSVETLARLTYVGSIVVLSVAIAIIASIAALWLAFKFRFDVSPKGMLLKILSAVVMGGAIAGMHYTAMAAARFTPTSVISSPVHVILASNQLGGAVVICAIIIIVLALIGAVLDRKAQARSAIARHLTEQTVQLSKSELQYRLLFDHNPNAMWVYAEKTREFLAVNAAALAGYGYTREEFLTMTMDEIRVDDADIRHRRKDGTLIDVVVTSQALVFDGFEACLTLALDVTDRKRAEEALRQSEQRTRLIINTALDAVVTMDSAGRITEWNTQAEKLFGWSREEILGKSMAETIIPVSYRERHTHGMRKFMEKGEGPLVNRRIEITALKRDGVEIPVELAISPARLGSEWTFSAFIRDLTEQKSLEAQLHHSSKMEAVGRLAGGVAHDFNNLLTVIISYASMLVDNLGHADGNREDAQAIASAAARAAGLTRQLLAFSRKQVLQPRVINVNAVVRDLESMLRRLIGEDIELVTSLDGGVGPINADPSQLEQVLMNLVVNARDAMPDGGRVTISTSNKKLSTTALRSVDADFVMLTVSDTGYGMSREVQQRLFDPFFTTKELGRGTGLGLSTVYGIVKQSGGEIYVNSELAIGTEFKVYFPRLPQSAMQRIDEVIGRHAPRGSETLLLVEDDKTLQTLAVRVLRNYGYDVLAADHGQQALAIACDPKTHIDAVITDVVMPGMNGRELVEKILRVHPLMPCLLMSGYADDDILRRGISQGERAFLQKPFTPEQLAQQVRLLLDTRHSAVA